MQQRHSQPTSRARTQQRLPAQRTAAPRRRNRDRWYLALAVAIAGVSLLAFAALIVAGADQFGGNGDASLQPGVSDQPPPATATVESVILSRAASPTTVATLDAAPTSAPPPVASRLMVCIDVGHGGVDLGNVRLNFDGTEILTMEKDLTLAQALALRDRLEAQGVEVVLTRETDTEVNATFEDVNGDGEVAHDVDGDGVIDQRLGEYPDELDELQARINVCNDAGADLMISIHVNGAENVFLQGYEAWYAENDALPFVAESAQFANLVVQNLGEQFSAAGYETNNRGAAPDSMLFLPDGEEGTFDHFVLLSPDVPERNYVGPKMPAVIVECLFLSHDDDYAFLTDDPDLAQDAIVTAYERAILSFFEDELPGAEGAEEEEAALQSFGGPGATADASPAGTPEADEDAEPTPTPRPEPLPDNGETAQVHYYGDSGREEIALTFDLGSDRGYTEQILDFLADKGITASFGMTGRWAEENPDLVQRIVDEGHMLINHTYSHRSFTGDSTGTAPLTTEERIEEIERTDEIVRGLTDYDMKPYFRLTYGDGATDPQVMRDIYAAGYYLVIMWTCDSYGWKQWTPAEIIQHCGSEEPGGIILMHVGSDGTDQVALPGLVEAYEDQGFDFVTVEEILQP